MEIVTDNNICAMMKSFFMNIVFEMKSLGWKCFIESK